MTDALLKGYVQRILRAPVYDVAIETPLQPAPRLAQRLGNAVLLKREDLQPVFSFKIRGAYNRVSQLSAEQRARGVIAASAGNHAQGLALAARHLGIEATIVMPRTTPSSRSRACSPGAAARCCTAMPSPRPWPMPCNWPRRAG